MQPTTKKLSGRTIAALWLMIAPTALFILGFIGFAILNWIGDAATPVPSSDGSLFAETQPTTTAGNILLFATGLIAFLTWLPGLIIGIVLLATQKK
ncbi:MAG: hypothetical protein WAV04_01935 [Candidatus Microsaccharimonas sp.]